MSGGTVPVAFETVNMDAMVESGSLALIVGPMFSGKTTELQRRIRRFQIARKRVLTIKYSGDTRYSEEAMATHDKREMAALPVSRLGDVPQASLDNADVIGIDEGSFFPDLLSFCDAQVLQH